MDPPSAIFEGERTLSLRLHIFGNGIGESIVIESPLGVGVIDSFLHNESVPPLVFLQQRKVRELHFLALTHPHRDHFGGIDKIVEHFSTSKTFHIKEFWRYPGLDWEHLYPVLMARAERKQGCAKEEQLELIGCLQRAYERMLPLTRRRPKLTVVQCNSRTRLVSDEQLTIQAFAPPGFILDECSSYVVAKLREASRAADNEPVDVPVTWNLNNLAVGMVISYQGHQVWLCSDVLRRSMLAAIEATDLPARSRVALLKVSHHGSAKDNPAVLLQRLFDGVECRVAVVTRYTPKGLPERQVLEDLDGRFESIYVLCSKPVAAYDSRGLRVQEEFPVERLEVSLSAEGVEVVGPVAG